MRAFASWNKMQYGLSDAVLLNSRYLVFLVNDQMETDILSQLDSHHIQNVSPQSPLSCGGRIGDADNCIFEKYMLHLVFRATTEENQISVSIHRTAKPQHRHF